MEQTEPSQVALREDVDAIKEEIGMLVEAMQALTNRENNPPPVVTAEETTPMYPPGFTPMYGFPPGYTPPIDTNSAGSDPPRPIQVQVPIMNEIPVAQENFNVPPGHLPPQVVGKNPQFTNPMPNAQETHQGVHLETPQNWPQHDDESKEKPHVLERRLRVVEGNNISGLDAFDMCLVPDVVIPAKFKASEFEKYKGLSCPQNHLIMFCRKMASHAHNNKLLIHCFQDSLCGASLNWYMHLERSRISSWKDLADAFLKQYKYNMDMAPDRMQLQNLMKKDKETFKEYAQRWRELAAQVEPPLSEKELVGMFMDTLQAPFYEKMIGSIL
ncbi:hypothetical protein P8452_61366 [Trifolium repens]|nr:hypothetical protein P8452_61366 [Trifolium repens]